MGDMNVVEYAEDTNGSTPIMHGGEERAWKRYSQDRDIVDTYLVVAQRHGPWYTRLRVLENDVEMSRLDRIYLTEGEEWIDNVAELTHHATSRLSDHLPIKAKLIMVDKQETERVWRSYFKASVEDFSDIETNRQVEEAWLDHPVSVQDPRIRWDLAWRRVMKVLKAARRKKQETNVSKAELIRELEKWRETLLTLDSKENRLGYRLTRDLLRENDLEEAKTWRKHCRSKWLREGDAPSRYFFAMWKAKVRREAILSLQKADGSIIDEPAQIVDEVGAFYTNLFEEEVEEETAPQMREQVLSNLPKRVPDELNRIMSRTPEVDEVEQRVKDLAAEKSPGLDGITAEVLRAKWPMIRGVIKLLPKNEERWLLTNWRPITLLEITYKLIAKILAERLKPFMASLVSMNQTGFIPGRSIFDNVLSLRFGQDWATASQQEALFLKLDFVKAYDRVRHSYLWATLEALGSGQETITLFQGLMVGAEAVVHVNGSFTKDFSMERGVRQGCPLAPFLFALAFNGHVGISKNSWENRGYSPE
ncbi:hypothetical protein R1sor_006357 [Riccia sorocarpa]|uniref:Reverse transcriptase domain-containing protein n=1 Tax=Riccia sorocarpa TaxID=122646 RepID=A0ABD3HPF6_9MARC